MRTLLRQRLFLRLAFVLGGALVVALAIAGTISLTIGSASLTRALDREMDSVAHAVHLEVERFLSSRRIELQHCSGVEAMDDVILDDPNFRIQNELLRLQRAHPASYEELVVARLDGTVVASTRIDRIGGVLRIAELAPVVDRDGVRVSIEPVSLPGSASRAMVFAFPLHSSLNRERTGWLVGSLRWSAVDGFIRSARVLGRPQDRSAFVVLSHRGRPLAGPLEWLPTRSPGDPQGWLVNRLAWQEELRRSRGDEAFVELSTISTDGWAVEFYRDANEALAPMRSFAWSVLVAGFVGFVIVGLVSLYLGRGFADRVQRLARGTERIAAGDFDHRIGDRHEDELGRLGASFDDMASRLRSARDRIEEVHDELQQNHVRLLEASRLKDEFLANTSHELRTPLNGILGYLGLVTDGLCDSEEEERESLLQAAACGHQLLRLIEDLLELSRLEAGRLALHCRPIPVAAAIEHVLSEYAAEARDRGITLTCEALADPDWRVQADERRLRQILRQLVHNALKFTPSGAVTLSCSEPPGAGFLRIAIRDTGVGVTPERMPHVFDRFVQGDGSSTRQHGGTGLGLALVRDLVELMGGVSRLESDGQGLGTTAWFTLPRWAGEAEDATVPPDAPDPQGEACSGATVVVLEDDPVLTGWLLRSLRAWGLRGVASATAEHAWMLLRQQRPALVLADHALPCAAGTRFRTGADLARRMAETPAFADIPVLLLTGHAPAVVEELAWLPPRVRLLRKPIEAGLLEQEVRAALRRSPASTSGVLLAGAEPAILASLRRSLVGEPFTISLEPDLDACLESVREDPGLHEVVVVPGFSDVDRARRFVDGILRLPGGPSVLWVGDPAGAPADADDRLRRIGRDEALVAGGSLLSAVRAAAAARAPGPARGVDPGEGSRAA